MSIRLRDPFSGLTHLGAAVIAAVGLAGLLIVGHDGFEKTLSLSVYGVSLILMFSASAAYHLIRGTPKLCGILRKLDHASIFLLIAGTYTPICLHFFHGFWKWGLLGIVWGMAVVGISVKVFIMNAPRWLSAGIYLVMGWLAIIAIKEIVTAMPAGAMVWLLSGGICFSLGAAVYIAKKPDFFPGRFGFHEVWHLFVIAGCVCHFILIAFFVALPARVLIG
jgi:hemolysin III